MPKAPSENLISHNRNAQSISSMHPWEWQPIEQEIVRTTTLRVRLLTAEQVARGWFAGTADTIAATRAILARLERRMLPTPRVLNAHSILKLRRPILGCGVGSSPPTEADWESVSTKAHSTWNRDHVPVEVNTAR